jgi:hypothetical protein
MAEKPTFEFNDAEGLINESLTLDYFSPNDDGVTPIPAHWVPGKGKLVVVVGENASGKSFFRRIVSGVCKSTGVECMPISMEGRGGYYGGLRGMIYGDESWQATGVNSARTVKQGILTCESRDKPHVIFWDEPDLGLSENGCAGIGVAIREALTEPPKHTTAAIVVTHSKPLVRELLPLDPHYLHLGSEDAPKTLFDWLQRPIVPRHPDELLESGHRRFKLIQTILNRVRG